MGEELYPSGEFVSEEEKLLKQFRLLQDEAGTLSGVWQAEKDYTWENVNAEMTRIHLMTTKCAKGQHTMSGRECSQCHSQISPTGDFIGSVPVNIGREIKKSIPIIVQGAKNSILAGDKYDDADASKFEAIVNTLSNVGYADEKQKLTLAGLVSSVIKAKIGGADAKKIATSLKAERLNRDERSIMLDAINAGIYNRPISAKVLDNEKRKIEFEAKMKALGVSPPTGGWKRKN